MHYVYLIKSLAHPDQNYIGQTDNLKERLETHNSGGSKYTVVYRPWRLITYVGFHEVSQALQFEKYLKSGSGRAFSKKRFW